MPTHRFTIGQTVRLAQFTAGSLRETGIEMIQSPLPPQDNAEQYRLYNEELNRDHATRKQDIEVILLT